MTHGQSAARHPYAQPDLLAPELPATGVSSRVRPKRHVGRGAALLRGCLDGRVLTLVIVLEVLVASYLLVPRSGVAAAGAGFGEYAASLAAGTGYRMQLPCGQLDVARRMPLQPVFLAAVALLGGGAWSAVVIKLVLLVGVAGISIARFAAERGRVWWRSPPWMALLAVLALCPMFAKHLSQLGYEEGWSIVLVPCLLVAGLAVLDPSPAARRSRPAWCFWFGALAAGLFLLKSAYLPLHLCACAALGWVWLGHGERRAGWALLLALAAPLGWSAFVFVRSGHASLGTSWDGENLFRGFCEACTRVYPSHSLDRLFDTPVIATPSGAVYTEALPARCDFPDEWAWDAHYRSRALAAAGSSAPGLAGYWLQKLAVVLVEVRPVPLLGAGGALRALLVASSFVLARGAIVLALVFGWRRRAELRRFAPGLVFASAALLALVAPLLVAFAYDRHTFVVLVAILFLAASIATMIHDEDRSKITETAA